MKKLGLILIAIISLSVSAVDTNIEVAPQVEVLHAADPFDGTFKTGLNLPINFTGMIYFRVLNIHTLVNQQLYVMFTFKNHPKAIYAPAIVSTAPGIMPDMHVEFLSVDLRGQAFKENINFKPLLCTFLGICPETTRIDIMTKNPLTGQLQYHTAAQRVKIWFGPESANNVGKDILYDEVNSCFTSMDCQAGNCCYNGRCWDRSLVGQCLEDSSSFGLPVGETCGSHYDCASLCCNANSRTCAPIVSKDGSELTCDQPIGSLCIDKTWCEKRMVKDCKIVKTGKNPTTGAPTCDLFCYKRQEHGECVNHTCYGPMIPNMPAFDPNNPNCSQAIDPLTPIN